MYGSVSEMCKAEKMNQGYVSRVLRLTLLAPDVVERILDGRRAPQLAQLVQPFPIEWDAQRELLCGSDA